MQSDLPDSVYAFPKKRKEPLTDARHVRNAVARFDQVTGVTDEERSQAFANIKKAAAYYDVTLGESSAPKRAATRKRSAAAKKKSTRKRKAR